MAWPERRIFAECDGGEWVKGSARRHGGATDCERWNALILAGWTGYRFVGSQVRSGYALKILDGWLRDQCEHNKGPMGDALRALHKDWGGFGIIAPEIGPEGWC